MKNIYWLVAGCVLFGVIVLITPAPLPESAEAPTTSVKAFTLAQVATHNNSSSCYTIVGGQVFDLSSWISKHPGGEKAILGLCGEDGTEAFTKQHGSNEKAQTALKSFFIGIVN